MTPVVILAGGRATRMGGRDKALLPFGARTLIETVLERMAPQGPCVISANGDPARFARFGTPVVADTVPFYAGPLAGVLAGLRWASGRADDIVTVPVDGPFVPRDLLARLHAARGDADIACAAAGGRDHPVHALWPVRLAADLQDALERGERKVAAWAARYRVVQVPFADPESFRNINSPDDLRLTESRAALSIRN